MYLDFGDTGQELWTLPGKPEREVSGPEWTSIKQKSFVIPFDSWTEISKFILKVCKDWQRCTEEEVPQVEDNLSKINAIMLEKQSYLEATVQ
jgi:hypothetical protein